MIRERRREDLDRLCDILTALDLPAITRSGKNPAEWLEEHDAAQSWVFDMAPVPVTPTRNVVGHVQILRCVPGPAADDVSEHTQLPSSELLAIDRLFVEPGPQAYGVARYLLKESVKYVRARGRVPVVELHEHGFLTRGFFERYGFTALRGDDSGAVLLVHPL